MYRGVAEWIFAFLLCGDSVPGARQSRGAYWSGGDSFRFVSPLLREGLMSKSVLVSRPGRSVSSVPGRSFGGSAMSDPGIPMRKSSFVPKELSGAMFKRKSKSENGADYVGDVMVNGMVYTVFAQLRPGKFSEFYALSLKPQARLGADGQLVPVV